ncbi:hypothetical protein BC829DRAFT_420812 [Chytridium lagenaria]|nr:hypothetical protein BC829DRAFT_420812 [Chytridium lagenaria]
MTRLEVQPKALDRLRQQEAQNADGTGEVAVAQGQAAKQVARMSAASIKSGKADGEHPRIWWSILRFDAIPNFIRMSRKKPLVKTAEKFHSSARWWFRTYGGCEDGWSNVAAKAADAVFRGNPCDANIVKTRLKALKTMEKQSAKLSAIPRATLLFFLMLRINELFELKMVDLAPGDKLMVILVKFRKTRPSDNVGKAYYLGDDPQYPALACYTNLKNWLSERDKLFPFGFSNVGYIFPSMRIKDNNFLGAPLFQLNSTMTDSCFVELTNSMLSRCSVNTSLEPRTGHGFRRGGAQFRFIDCRPRWDLDRLRWWGDWETVITYVFKKMNEISKSYPIGSSREDPTGIMPEALQKALSETVKAAVTAACVPIHAETQRIAATVAGTVHSIQMAVLGSMAGLMGGCKDPALHTTLQQPSPRPPHFPPRLHHPSSFPPPPPRPCSLPHPQPPPLFPPPQPTTSLPTPSAPLLPPSTGSVVKSRAPVYANFGATSLTPFPIPAISIWLNGVLSCQNLSAPVVMQRFNKGKGLSKDPWRMAEESFYEALYQCWYLGDPTSLGQNRTLDVAGC